MYQKTRKQKTKLIVIEGRQCRVQRKYMCIIMFNPSVSHNAVGVLWIIELGEHCCLHIFHWHFLKEMEIRDEYLMAMICGIARAVFYSTSFIHCKMLNFEACKRRAFYPVMLVFSFKLLRDEMRKHWGYQNKQPRPATLKIWLIILLYVYSNVLYTVINN